jgi:hypothetical protein
MCQHFDMMGIFFLHSEIWGRNWELNKGPIQFQKIWQNDTVAIFVVI